MLSIITVVRNGARTIGNCLESVRRQTVRPEHIIIDGLSTDGTLEILAAAQRQDPGLIVVSERDSGIYDAMRKGIARARGEVIGCLNADDFYARTTVLEQVAGVFADAAIDSCYGDLLYVRPPLPPRNRNRNPTRNPNPPDLRPGDYDYDYDYEGSLVLAKVFETDHRSPTSEISLPNERIVRRWRAGAMSRRAFHWGWMPPHPTVFVRRSVYACHGDFRLDMGTAADYELMLRLLVKHGITTRYLPAVLVKMLVGGVSNRSLRNRLAANRNDRRAWTVNGLRPYPWTLWLKPVRKLGQWVGAEK